MRGRPGWLAFALMLTSSASQTAAKIPSPDTSTIPGLVLLVGRTEALADTASGAITVVLRSVAGTPMPGLRVEIRMLNCPGARVAVDQFQPGVSARCETNGVLAETDLDGSVRMAIVGGGDANAPLGSGPCGTVLGGGAALGTIRVAYLDLDGSGGLGTNDLSIWLGDFGTGEPIARADYDGDDTVGASDLSLWLGVWGEGRSCQSAPSYCTGFRRGP